MTNGRRKSHDDMISYRVERFGEPLVETRMEPLVPTGTQVVVEVSACGVCHSDLHLSDGFFSLGDGNKVDATRIVAPPRTLGHEIAGTVAAVGPDVRGLALGAKRVVYPWIGCGRCALCDAGREHLCNSPAAIGLHRDGGFARFVLVPHPRYLVDFAPFDDAQACTYACSGLTAYGALKKVPALAAGDALLIIGAGGVGLSGIRLAGAVCGVAPIVAEINPEKWRDAREAGASEVIDPTAPGATKALLKATGGGFTGVVDFVGAAATFEFGFGVLRKAGHMVSVGLIGGSARVPPALVAMKALTLAGSYVGSLAEMHELIAIARTQHLPELPVTSRPLVEVNAAIAELKGGRVHGRIVLRP